jgi:transcriptional/translational regulatory protein YebC/TACO1
MFEEKGLITIIDEDDEIDEDTLMEAALEAGASDFEGDEGCYEIYTEIDDLAAVREALEAAGYKLDSAERAMVPSSYVELTSDEDIKHMELLLEYLEDDDDVQNVFHNWSN